MGTVQDKCNYLLGTKNAIKTAISSKGVAVNDSDTFRSYAEKINSIDTGVPGGIDTSDATAVAADLLSGKTAYARGSKIAGSMVNQGAISQTLNNGASYTVPAGYHNGNGVITVPSLATATSGTATAADIAKGKTAWVNGVKITGELYLPFRVSAIKAEQLSYSYDWSASRNQLTNVSIKSSTSPTGFYFVKTNQSDIVGLGIVNGAGALLVDFTSLAPASSTRTITYVDLYAIVF